MFIDGRQIERDSTIEADLCIVGAGPAGIAIAEHFLATSLSVIIIESGGLDWEEEAQVLADFDVEGPRYFTPRETRLRGFGGNTRAWAGVCIPLDPWDFDKRPWVPNSGWPFSYSALQPYFDRARKLCNVAAPTFETPDQFMNNRKTGWAKIEFASPDPFRTTLRRKLKRSHEINVLLNSTATHLQLNEHGNRIDSMDIRCLDDNRYTVKARQNVLACGGIENPRLLLASNNVARDGIGNDYDVVGRYFMEHCRVTDRWRLPSRHDALAKVVPSILGRTSCSRLQLTNTAQRDSEVLGYHANLLFGYSSYGSEQWEAVRRIVYSIRNREAPYFPDLKGGVNKLTFSDAIVTMKRPGDTLKSLVGTIARPPCLRRWLEIISTVEQPPDPRNRVVLAKERDPFGLPKAKLEWDISALEEKTYRIGLKHILDDLESIAPGLCNAGPIDADQWPTGIVGTWHHLGTTRMHESPRLGVVDSDCAVFGINNLSIAGSSVFPTGGTNSPTLTIVALALRLAERLQALLRGNS